MKPKNFLKLLIPLALFPLVSHADLEPSLGDTMTAYLIEDIQGASKVELLLSY